MIDSDLTCRDLPMVHMWDLGVKIFVPFWLLPALVKAECAILDAVECASFRSCLAETNYGIV